MLTLALVSFAQTEKRHAGLQEAFGGPETLNGYEAKMIGLVV